MRRRVFAPPRTILTNVRLNAAWRRTTVKRASYSPDFSAPLSRDRTCRNTFIFASCRSHALDARPPFRLAQQTAPQTPASCSANISVRVASVNCSLKRARVASAHATQGSTSPCAARAHEQRAQPPAEERVPLRASGAGRPQRSCGRLPDLGISDTVPWSPSNAQALPLVATRGRFLQRVFRRGKMLEHEAQEDAIEFTVFEWSA